MSIFLCAIQYVFALIIFILKMGEQRAHMWNTHTAMAHENHISFCLITGTLCTYSNKQTKTPQGTKKKYSCFIISMHSNMYLKNFQVYFLPYKLWLTVVSKMCIWISFQLHIWPWYIRLFFLVTLMF